MSDDHEQYVCLLIWNRGTVYKMQLTEAIRDEMSGPRNLLTQ